MSLPPDLIGRLQRLRLATRRRVQGRFTGLHSSRRFGTSLDFADYRDYTPGDDPRTVDRHASARSGRLLVRLFDAEDEAALRVVVDASASMGFGEKWRASRAVAVGLVTVAAAGGDRARVLLAGANLDPGPWLRGPAAMVQAEQRLAAAAPGGRADIGAALRRAHGDGPAGPVVLVSDLLFDGWQDILVGLAGRGDATLVHLLGRADLEPSGLHGDVRLSDTETGEEVEVAISDAALEGHTATRDRWLADVAATCGGRGVAYVRLVDDDPVEALFAVELPRLGVVL